MVEAKPSSDRTHIETSKEGARAYALGIKGGFFAPEILDGWYAVFDPEAGRPGKNEIVAVWIKGTPVPFVVRLALALPPADLLTGGDVEPVMAVETEHGARYMGMNKVERVDRLIDIVH